MAAGVDAWALMESWTCPPLLLPSPPASPPAKQNNSFFVIFIFLATFNNTNLLSHSFHGSGLWQRLAGSTAQGPTGWNEGSAGLWSHLRLEIFFHVCSGCRWNSIPWGFKGEGPIFLLAVGCGLPSAPRGCSQGPRYVSFSWCGSRRISDL